MPARTFAAAAALAALTACGGSGTPAGPASSAPPKPVATACDLLTTVEATAVLHVGAVEVRPLGELRCLWAPRERTAASAYFSVTLIRTTTAFASERARHREQPGFHEVAVGDEAYFLDGRLRVRKGGSALLVAATSDVDRTKKWPHIEPMLRNEYERIATEAARVAATRL